MNDQLTFDYSKPLTIADRFEEFDRLNPQVLRMLESKAARLIDRGWKRIGIGWLCEVLRYEYAIETNDPNSKFRLNNDFRSRYARLLIEKHPDWSDIIATRELRSI